MNPSSNGTMLVENETADLLLRKGATEDPILKNQFSQPDIMTEIKNEIVVPFEKDNKSQTRKVLAIVSDESSDWNVIENWLHDNLEHHCELFTAKDFESINQIIKANDLSLIIADWNLMTDRTGVNYNPEKILGAYNIPLLLLTEDFSFYKKVARLHFSGDGLVDCIQKPIDLFELSSRARLLMDITDRIRKAKHETELVRRELNLKHQELHLELIIHSESVKEKFLENVRGLDSYLNNEGKLKLRQITKQFRWAIKEEANVNFQRAYDEMNSELYEHLERICPKITRSEKRLCAFTVKNHSGTDIAKTTGKSQNSINVAFARLRSKLGISNNKELKKLLTEIVEREPA